MNNNTSSPVPIYYQGGSITPINGSDDRISRGTTANDSFSPKTKLFHLENIPIPCGRLKYFQQVSREKIKHVLSDYFTGYSTVSKAFAELEEYPKMKSNLYSFGGENTFLGITKTKYNTAYVSGVATLEALEQLGLQAVVFPKKSTIGVWEKCQNWLSTLVKPHTPNMSTQPANA